MFICFALAPRAVCCLAIGMACVPAASFAGSGPITLVTAIERTLGRNPDLQSFAYRLRVQEARTQTAALRPPLTVNIGMEDAFGTGRASGFDAAETTFAISHVIELGGVRERRLDTATAESKLIETERAAAQLDVLVEVTRRFIRVAAAQEQFELTRRATALAEQTVSAADARIAAARAPEVELRRARISLARVGIEQEHAEHELSSSRRKLAAMWGESSADFDAIDADLYRLPVVDTFESLLARLDTNPDFLRFASEARLRDAEARLAQAQARSDITLSAGLRRLQQTRDEAFVLGFSMPLFGTARAQGAISAANALRLQTDVERAAQRVRAEAQLFELHQELRHTIEAATVLRNSVLPETEAALEATREAFERGRYSYLEWVDAQRELVDVQRALIEASANAHLYRAEIERLTGEALPVTN